MNALRHWIQSVLTQLGQRVQRWNVLVFGMFLGMVLALLLTARFQGSHSIEVGAPSPRTVNAPRELTFVSDVATQAARNQAANDPANIVYQDNPQLPQSQRQQLQQTFTTITSIRDNPGLSDAEKLLQITELPSIAISTVLAETILSLSDEDWQRVRDEVNKLYDRTLREYDYLITDRVLEQIKRGLPYQLPNSLGESQRASVLFFVEHTLQPNRILNQESTQKRIQDAQAAVAPVYVTVYRGENIVRQGDRVSAEQYERLVKLGIISPSLNFNSVLGRILLALLIGAALAVYIGLFYPALATRQRPLWVIGSLLISMVLVGRWFISFWTNAPEIFPLAIIGLALAVLFDIQLALVVSVLTALLIGFVGDGSYALTLISLAGSIGGVFSLRRTDRATHFLIAGVGVATAVFLTTLIWRLVRPASELSIEAVLTMFGLSLANGGFSALLTFGVHNLLGRLAGILTPSQLMELAHPNQPLLRRLMQEAPGTYHHSIVVSNLAEQAAERIGADPLLTRVGAYYHDIGKMLRPYFFTDNQYDRSNVHDDLDPQTSAKIIADHVIEGARLARRSGLPQQVVDFILQHHGKDTIRYFYQKALQQEDNPNIADYQYPGPKPQNKETAILMLADGIEATVRSREQAGQLISERELQSLPEGADPPRNGQTIAQVVQQIINARVSSGQLDECPLTLYDIQKIRDSFTKTLQGIYHPRVEYPRLTKDMQNQ